MQKIAELQSIRAIAILMVSVVHFTVLSVVLNDHTLYPYGTFFTGLAPILSQGRLGVELFFMVSGFVITLTLKNCSTLKEFWLKRALRLYVPLTALLPMVWITANLSPDFQYSSKSALDLVFSLTLVDPQLLNAITGSSLHIHATTAVTWSLWIELQFYLIASLVYFKSNAFIRNLSLLALPMFALALVSRTHYWLPMLQGTVGPVIVSLIGLSAYFPWFLAGACIHEVRFGEAGKKFQLFFVYVACWLATCASEFAIKNYIWFLIANSLIFLLFQLLSKDAPVPILNSKILAWIGEISYEYYLVHEVLGIALIKFLAGILGSQSPVLSVTPLFALFPFAYLSYAFWSRPVMGFLRKRLIS